MNTKQNPQSSIPPHLQNVDPDSVDWKAKDDTFWRSVLSSEQYRVCRTAGTERPFSGEHCALKSEGAYSCVCCGAKLFATGAKFESGTGWPSFTSAVDSGALKLNEDISHGMVRTEVCCKRCDAHLGHVFDDGPPPTGKRFCINSVCLFTFSQ